MIYSHEQLSQALYLVYELELTETARKTQRIDNPWLYRQEALALMSVRMVCPVGMAEGILHSLHDLGCLKFSLKQGYIRLLKPVVPVGRVAA